ncbi:MAG: site-specific integrase [Crocinitomicaceae bacterium]|nr:site-specific integrase [Crocinitomicaceae bacterium]
MSGQQKLKIKFRLNTQKSKKGESPIYIRIYLDGRKAEVSTGHMLSTSLWDSKKERVKATHGKASYLNAYLDRCKNEIQQNFLDFQSRGILINVSQLKNKFLGIEEKSNHKTINDIFEYHNKKAAELVDAKKIIAKTHLRYKITKNKVLAFIEYQYQAKDISLPDLGFRFVTEFEHYLLTVDKLQSNTAYKYIKILNKVMNLAVRLEWINANPIAQFKCSYKDPERIILTQSELNSIMSKEIGTQKLAEVRDVFIFCCYTGFAYSEIHKFSRNSVTKGIDGDLWITTNRMKTGTRESVPLLPIPLEIIKKYKDHEYCMEYNKLLPVNSNQRYNNYLKELAAICEIDKNVTTHIARHTFATTVTLSNGVPIETVSKMLGHTKLATTQIYAKVLDGKVSDDMKKLKNVLHPPADQSKDSIDNTESMTG